MTLAKIFRILSKTLTDAADQIDRQQPAQRLVGDVKYILTDESLTLPDGRQLHRIKAVSDIPGAQVRAGNLGGFIESERNLSQAGRAWVGGDARVFDEAQVYDDGQVYDDAWVSGKARVFGEAQVFGEARLARTARVFGKARVGGDVLLHGDAHVGGDTLVYSNPRCGDKAGPRAAP